MKLNNEILTGLLVAVQDDIQIIETLKSNKGLIDKSGVHLDSPSIVEVTGNISFAKSQGWNKIFCYSLDSAQLTYYAKEYQKVYLGQKMPESVRETTNEQIKRLGGFNGR